MTQSDEAADKRFKRKVFATDVQDENFETAWEGISCCGTTSLFPHLRAKHAIVRGAMQDMYDDQLSWFSAIEDQVIAVNAQTDTMVFVAWDEGEAVWVDDEIFTPAAQLPNE